MYQRASTYSLFTRPTSTTMSSDPSWEPEYCLYCDRQTDGALYCSESCRLRDFESSSTSLSSATNQTSLASSSAWSVPRNQTKFYLSPAYDFTNARPYGSTPSPQSPVSQQCSGSRMTPSTTSALTPSSSHSSLCSLGSTVSTTIPATDGTQISAKTKKHLRDYASSFEHARNQTRRPSY
ncbi:hypothetical protein F5Y17DRAFT_421444 [Xylariaceae sp. FL0594]|nr:hypothetical protein F5Y17DRAFT_421444 [Xylariaceae sp. FL0594]